MPQAILHPKKRIDHEACEMRIPQVILQQQKDIAKAEKHITILHISKSCLIRHSKNLR